MARVVRVDVAALGDGAAEKTFERLGDASDGEAETSAAFGPESVTLVADASADATRAEDDAVLGVERRLAVDAADAAALKAAAVAARRAASEATRNELLARERLEAARAEIARLRAESSAAEDSREFAALPESAANALPAPAEPFFSLPVPERERVDVAVGSSPPVSPREAREAGAQTAWMGDVASAPLADVGVGVGPSLPGSERSTPPASPRESARFASPPADSVSAADAVDSVSAADAVDSVSAAEAVDSVSASPLESLAAANLEFAFSPEVESPKNLGESPRSGESTANRAESVSPQKSAPSAASDARARARARRAAGGGFDGDGGGGSRARRGSRRRRRRGGRLRRRGYGHGVRGRGALARDAPGARNAAERPAARRGGNAAEGGFAAREDVFFTRVFFGGDSYAYADTAREDVFFAPVALSGRFFAGRASPLGLELLSRSSRAGGRHLVSARGARAPEGFRRAKRGAGVAAADGGRRARDGFAGRVFGGDGARRIAETLRSTSSGI